MKHSDNTRSSPAFWEGRGVYEARSDADQFSKYRTYIHSVSALDYLYKVTGIEDPLSLNNAVQINISTQQQHIAP